MTGMIKDFIEALNAFNNKTAPYDVKGEVKRIEGKTAWVRLNGGVDETPVEMTINCIPGEIVRVRVSGGHAWIAGNETSPPTDDRLARRSYYLAEAAQEAAGRAWDYTDEVKIYAIEIDRLAHMANETANGKNKVYRQGTKPTGGTYADGDIWFDTANGNAIYRYSESAADFVAVALGDDAIEDLSANKLTAGTIDASVITVSNLDAGNITTGTMIADFIRGGLLLLGGSNNTNGVLEIRNSGGTTILNIDNKGIYADYSAARHTRIDKAGVRAINYHATQGIYNGYEANAVSLEGRIQFYTKYATTPFDYDGTLSECGWIICERDFQDNNWIMSFAAGNDSIFYISSSGTYKINLTNSTDVSGNFRVSGTKSRVVDTEDYSNRLLYCYETASPMFGDIGEGVIGDDGKTYIPLDPIFAKTIAEQSYQVFLQMYGQGTAYVSERHPAHFIVEGTPGLEFAWEIKAKQTGYTQTRLEDADRDYTVDADDYGTTAAAHLEEIQRERGVA